MMKSISNRKVIRVLFHVLFWVGLILFMNSKIMGIQWGPLGIKDHTLFWALVYGMAFNATLFYLNAYWQIPKFIHPRNYKLFILTSLALLVGITAIEMVIDYIYIHQITISDPSNPNLKVSGDKYFNSFSELAIFLLFTLIFNVFFWSAAFMFRLPRDWVKNERQKQELVRDKLIAELEFLKAQINPHFLFNGINSIYHLIGQDSEIAQSVLLKFSDLLRYQLYECNEEYISIGKEVQYVRNYIDLQMVRKGEDAIINASLPDQETLDSLNSIKIAPLLLNPFLENAFKYLSLFSERSKNILIVELSVIENTLHFFVKNSIDLIATSKKIEREGGIGLENVKRRLAIIYKDKYQLDVNRREDFFEVSLKIHLI